MSKAKNSVLGWVAALGTAGVIAYSYFVKKTGTKANTEVGFDVTDLSISLADFGNLNFLDATLPPYMSYDLVVNCINKSGKGVPCKRMVIEISDGTKRITSLEAVDKDGLDIAYFKPRMTSQATIGIRSEMWRTFELLGMTYTKFADKIKKQEIPFANVSILKWLFDNTNNFRAQQYLWDDVKQAFTNSLKFQKTLTIKCTAYLQDQSGNTFSTSTTKQFEI